MRKRIAYCGLDCEKCVQGLSNKMKQIANNPVVAISGEWSIAHVTI